MASIEFYLSKTPDRLFAQIWDEKEGAVPRKGEAVVIKDEVYTVVSVTWRLDKEAVSLERKLRACIAIKKSRTP